MLSTQKVTLKLCSGPSLTAMAVELRAVEEPATRHPIAGAAGTPKEEETAAPKTEPEPQAAHESKQEETEPAPTVEKE